MDKLLPKNAPDLAGKLRLSNDPATGGKPAQPDSWTPFKPHCAVVEPQRLPESLFVTVPSTGPAAPLNTPAGTLPCHHSPPSVLDDCCAPTAAICGRSRRAGRVPCGCAHFRCPVPDATAFVWLARVARHLPSANAVVRFSARQRRPMRLPRALHCSSSLHPAASRWHESCVPRRCTAVSVSHKCDGRVVFRARITSSPGCCPCIGRLLSALFAVCVAMLPPVEADCLLWL